MGRPLNPTTWGQFGVNLCRIIWIGAFSVPLSEKTCQIIAQAACGSHAFIFFEEKTGQLQLNFALVFTGLYISKGREDDTHTTTLCQSRTAGSRRSFCSFQIFKRQITPLLFWGVISISISPFSPVSLSPFLWSLVFQLVALFSIVLDTYLLLLFERFVIFDKISHRDLFSRSSVIQRKVSFFCSLQENQNQNLSRGDMTHQRDDTERTFPVDQRRTKNDFPDI